ncbi:MAG TPA: hypothetical protein VM888_11355, partial [Chitinophagaceae bacterium]|nr:hypothetical protein [Chitinophagaceae bacterium]
MRPMLATLRLLFCIILTSFSVTALAQTTACKDFKPPLKRQLFHEYIDREQKAALRADGKVDNLLYTSANEDINYLVTQSIISKVDALQCRIERDSSFAEMKKVTYIRGLEKLLKNFTTAFKASRFNASNLPAALETYEAAMEKDSKGQTIESIIDKKSYEIGNLVVSSGAFDNNAGNKVSRYTLLRKYLHLHPNQIFSKLRENPDLPFRDSLIKVGGYKFPRLLYDFAAANNQLGYAIRRIDDPLISAVSKMATSGGSGQLYFPFLDNILKGRQTIAEIDAAKNDDVKYYKLLVKTRQDYVERLMQKDTIYEMQGLTDRLEKKAKEVFIKEINGLHESPDNVRFRILHQLNAKELYYLAVFSEDEIYTSSYTRGVYPIMMQKIGNRGDSLLYSVGFDRFKKFIKMAAGYNTLGNFLNTFSDKQYTKSLMTAFVNGLEKSEGLEDGVDVADSYVSISESDKDLAKFILDLTKQNYEKNLAQNNQRGMVMYNLLNKLFLSADTTNNIDLSKEFGIPPVYNVSYSSLAGDSNQVVMQVFFYGDEDGRNNYAGFMRQFGSTWRRSENKQWVSLTSTRGKPILIFANKPLPTETSEDEEAQKAMMAHIRQKGYEPSIVIHRGHSYYAESTIQHIMPSAKIVFLGSCGGYHLIHDVLEHSPDAHIIASKQIGKGVINQPFFDLLDEKLMNGSNIDWIPFWSEFRKRAG